MMQVVHPNIPRAASRAMSMTSLRLWFLGLALLVMLACAHPAFAAPLPFADRRVDINARDQQIGGFLRSLFGQIDVPVVISPEVKGNVNGTFAGDADQVLRNVSRAFGLVLYYDGSVMYVYTGGETTTRTLTLPNSAAAEKIRRIAKEMNLIDGRNYLRSTSDGVLMATGTKRFLDQIEELYKADAARREPVNTTSTFRVFQLRYAWAQDTTVEFGTKTVMVPGVATLLRSLLVTRGRWQAPTTSNVSYSSQTVPKLKGQGLAKSQQPVLGFGDDGATAEDPNRGTASDIQMFGDAASVRDVRGVVGAADAHVRIQADPRMNAIIIRDTADRMPEYEQLIQSLDVEPVSIEIEATIIDVDTDRATELGVNWRYTKGRSSVLNGSGTESDLRLQPGVVGAAITPSAAGGVVSAVLGDASQFIARVSALQTQGVARVVSSPQVVTLSNVEAVFDNSQTFYVRVAGREQVDLFNVSAGTSLRVTPHVFKDNDGMRIKLLVNLQDAAISSKQVDQIPIVARSSINTQAMIYEGESLLLGGLTRDSSSESSTGIPVISNIPVVGHLFKTTTKSGGRVERLFLISPRLNTRRVVQPPAVTPQQLAPRGYVAPQAPAVAPAPATPPARSAAATPAPTNERRRTAGADADPFNMVEIQTN